MTAIQRRAHIEFIGKKTVMITTFCNQKQFELTKECVIDLVTLTKSFTNNPMFEPTSPFFVYFGYDNTEDSYIGEIIAQIEKSEHDVIGISDWKTYNKSTFRVSVCIND